MKRSERGASLVEMAIITPLLVLLMVGVADMGWAFHDYIIITNAAREGARVASRLPCRPGNVSQQQALTDQIVGAVNADAVGLKPGGPLTISITPNPVGTNCGIITTGAGSPYTVRVTKLFPTFMGSFIGWPTLTPWPTLTLASQTAMAWFGND